jgi:hypothetical protein
MSIRLVPIDLTGASVGTTGQVQIPQPKVQVGEVGHLRLYNESGCGITVTFSNGHSEVIPAGAWPMFEVEPEVQTYTWLVNYVLPNAPVAVLESVYYFPYEGVPPTPALGNSPIGITGGVSTSSVQTLSNETNAANTLVIDIGDTGNVNLLTLYTDGHTLWKVDQSGVLHQVLKVQVSGNPLQLGQAGDIIEFLGSLLAPNNVAYQGKDTFGVTQELLKVGSNNFTLVKATSVNSEIRFVDQTGNLLAWFNAAGGGVQNAAFTVTGSFEVDAGGLNFSSKKLFDGSANNLADWSALGGGLFLKGNPAVNGKFHYQGNGANDDFSIAAISKFNGTGSGNFSHGLQQFGAAVTPDIIIPVQSVAGSQTMGYNTLNSTTVNIVTGAGNAWVALAIKL